MKKFDIPKNATAFEIMQLGQIDAPEFTEYINEYPDGLDLSILRDNTNPKKIKRMITAYNPVDLDLREAMLEDINRQGDDSGNDFLITQGQYRGTTEEGVSKRKTT